MLPNAGGRRKGARGLVNGAGPGVNAKQAARLSRTACSAKGGWVHQIGSGTQFLNLPTVVPGVPTPEQTGLP